MPADAPDTRNTRWTTKIVPDLEKQWSLVDYVSHEDKDRV